MNVKQGGMTMRSLLAIVALFSGFSLAHAQNTVARPEALKGAFMVSADLASMLDTPIPTDPDVKRPAAVHAGGRALLVLPETKLNAAVFAKLGKEATPIGQLWLLKLAPQSEGQVVEAAKLHIVSVNSEKGALKVVLCALGARSAGDHAELLIYGKGKEPLLRAPLTPISTPQDSPIEVSADDSGQVTLNILGKYTATFTVGEATQE
jgi:hypothetical protein